ncbi:chemotaxis protein CheB [Arenimonas oryziterrae]|uniref:protein-glutamate methylesterase n=1 Tax=Arenimonas oryziterrae DSM 21050 = YC6267 TaxID=1121015 RepID=A0A091AVX8_9GAMM|nr:chemotaxis protein CheB [Arenimonas oryziterrae]KFN43412.1 hypothetical protein N789_09055 [Arenimonas oryziterrae DSM 21050 = YC6267]
MAESAVRVALLARPGNARDQLHRALTELGAILVAEGDPSELDPGTVVGQSPTLVLVSLEPAIEPALDRFDALLSTPGIEVMYDDAEVTRDLDGWDLNRWARHLAAKLLGSDTLPPVPGGSDPLPELDMTPVPGLPPTPAQLMDSEKLEDYAQDAPDLADWVPTNPSLTETPAQAEEPAPAPEIAEAEEISLDLDIGDIELALQGIDAPTVARDTPLPQAEQDSVAAAPTSLDDFSFEFDTGADSAPTLGDSFIEAAAPVVASEEFIDAAPAAGEADEFSLASIPAADDLDFVDDTPASSLGGGSEDEPLLADLDVGGEPVRFSNFDEDHSAQVATGMDDDVAALAAQLEAFEKTDTRREVKDPDFSLNFDTEAAPPPRSAGAAQETSRGAPSSASQLAAKVDFGNLSLLGEDEDHSTPAAPAKVEASSSLLGSVANLELVAMDASAEGYQNYVAGAVVIIAGLGGPDAVRQMLSSLPEKMPVPVLLYQHLEAGKHERLVDQLGKISKLPVVLAEEGAQAQPGKVSVLPAGLSAVNEHGALRFTSGPLTELISVLRPAESVVVLLSGADVDLVPAVMRLQSAGGIAMAQDPDSCFDPAAPQVMTRQGAPSYPALGLAQKIATRWSV